MLGFVDRFWVRRGLRARDLKGVRWRGVAYLAIGAVLLLCALLLGGIVANLAA